MKTRERPPFPNGPRSRPGRAGTLRHGSPGGGLGGFPWRGWDCHFLLLLGPASAAGARSGAAAGGRGSTGASLPSWLAAALGLAAGAAAGIGHGGGGFGGGGKRGRFNSDGIENCECARDVELRGKVSRARFLTSLGSVHAY